MTPLDQLVFGSKLLHFVQVVSAQFLRKFQSCHLRYVGERIIALGPYMSGRDKKCVTTEQGRTMFLLKADIEYQSYIPILQSKERRICSYYASSKISLLCVAKGSTKYCYVCKNIEEAENNDDPRNFFLPKSKSEKNTRKHVKTCGLSSGIHLRQVRRGARFGHLSGEVRSC